MRAFIESYLIWFKIGAIVVLALAGWYAWNQFTGHYKEIGRVEVRKELQPKLDEAIKEKTILSNNLNLQNAAVKVLGDAKKEADKRYLAAIKANEPIVRATEKKIEALRHVPVRSGPNLTCSDKLNDIKSLLDEAHR
jgi:hypothetical protein